MDEVDFALSFLGCPSLSLHEKNQPFFTELLSLSGVFLSPSSTADEAEFTRRPVRR
jgi:hypothetical protein